MSFRIDPRLPLTGEVRRILTDEVGKALAHLEMAREKPEQGLHKCRKRLKSVRALLRLVRSGDETFCTTENECYKQVSALLAGPREATALIETIDRLAASFPEQSAGGGLDAVRDRLVMRQHEMHAGAGLDAAISAAAAACREGLGHIDRLSLPDQPEQAADILAEGARRKAVDSLGERLGELQDVFVMRALLDADGTPLGPPEDTKLLAKLLKRSEKSLRKSCLAEAAELFGDSPKRSTRKLARKARDDLAGAQEDLAAAG